MFNDQAIVITGASSGIGAALARRFAALGARTALVARRHDRLQEVARDIAAAGRPEPVVIQADLFEDSAHAQVLDQAREALGRIDVLVNNAGLGFTGRFAELSPEQVEHMLQLNVRALVRMTHLVLPEMLERGSGGIMNVASTAAYQPMGYMAVYAATKAFVLNFSVALWAECRRRGVVVTSVNPGTTLTEFFDGSTWDRRRRLFLKHAMSADRVAAIGIKALARGRPKVICGLGNRALACVSWLMPRSWTARATASVLKPRP